MNARNLTTGKMLNEPATKTTSAEKNLSNKANYVKSLPLTNSASKEKESFSRWIGETVNNLSGQTAVMEFNANEAKKAREHELFKMQNAYQMSTKDMIAAGLNPGLMYGSGGAEMASSASQASASGNGAGIINGITNVFTSAAKLINANDNTKNIEAQNKIYNSAAKTLNSVLKLIK